MVDQKQKERSDAPSGDEPPVPSQGGTSGGGLQREIGSADEERTATGADPQSTSVHKGQKPDEGDESNLPDRSGTGETGDR